MSIWNEAVRDFPDRAFRLLLENTDNLRELISDLVPDVAARLDFSRRELIGREFLLEDWRARESDLLFRIPYRAADAEQSVLVCLLLEHQSVADPRMPLRLLLYAVLYWEREWKAWETRHEYGVPLRLTPVLPVVFHTGLQPWVTNRQLADLFADPEELRRFAPQWPTLFWDLAEHDAAALLASGAAWLQALAVVRAEAEESAAFQTVLGDVLPHLVKLRQQDKIRSLDLLGFILTWATRRRPPTERRGLQTLVQTRVNDLTAQQELMAMGKLLEKTYDEEWAEKVHILAAEEAKVLAAEQVKVLAAEQVKVLAAAEAKVLAAEQAKVLAAEQAKVLAAEQAKVLAAEQAKVLAVEQAKVLAAQLELAFGREMLRGLLEDRFGLLSADVVQRIEACADLPRLKAAVRQVQHLSSANELTL